MALANIRNGSSFGSYPNIWTGPTGDLHAVMITSDWDVVACRRVSGSATWETISLTTVAANVLDLPIVSSDNHYQAMCAVDNQNRMHVWANMHANHTADGGKQGPMRYVRCDNPAAFTTAGSWVNAASTIDVAAISNEQHTYFRAQPGISDDLYLVFNAHRDDVNGEPGYIGQRWILQRLVADADTWVPVVGEHGVFQEANRVVGDGDPDRPYTLGFYVDPSGGLHLVGMWRWAATDPDSAANAWYIRSVDGGTTWTTVDGTVVTLPLTGAITAAASECEFTDVSPVSTPSTIITDPEGNPHISALSGFLSWNDSHWWWDGNAWQTTAIPGVPGENATLVWHRGGLWLIGWAQGRCRFFNLANTSSIKLTGDVPIEYGIWGNVSSYLCELDPIAHRAGVVRVFVPDGDTPVAFSFGDNARLRAAS